VFGGKKEHIQAVDHYLKANEEREQAREREKWEKSKIVQASYDLVRADEQRQLENSCFEEIEFSCRKASFKNPDLF
jgi:hypothetical protein